MYHTINYIHQILITDNASILSTLPLPVQRNMNNVKEFYPDAEYKIWSDKDIRSLLVNNFEKEVLEKYDSFEDVEDKVRLGSYCILYIYGGIYFDLSLDFLSPWNIPKSYAISAFKDTTLKTENLLTLMPNLLWSVPRRYEWRYAIDCIKQMLYLGGNHCNLLGYAFASAYRELSEKGEGDVEDQFVGVAYFIAVEVISTNIVFIDLSEKTIAVYSKNLKESLI